VSDEPPRRSERKNFVETVWAMRETFLSAGIDPLDQDSRERFAAEHRWVRGRVEKQTSRGKWIASVWTTVFVALLTASVTALVPICGRLLAGWMAR
jgi:hypothetical protein